MKARHLPKTSRRRAVALLMTLLVLVALILIVAQIQTSAAITYKQIRSRTYVRQCQRALDSAPAMVARMLTEEKADLATDSLGDEWNWPKMFTIDLSNGSDNPDLITVTIRVEDVDRKYDLKGLLEENADALDKNIENFVDFAAACGLDPAVASRLAHTIADEAALRRSEDEVTTQQNSSTTASSSGGVTMRAVPTGTTASSNQSATGTTTETMPLWLDDFLSLPQLSEEDRQAIRTASIERDDPATEEVDSVAVRFMDEVTVWRDGVPNVNTADREVLLYGVPSLRGTASTLTPTAGTASSTAGAQHRETVVDDIIKYRAEKPFTNLAQLANIAGLPRQTAERLGTELRLNSGRFRIVAEATYRSAAPDSSGETAPVNPAQSRGYRARVTMVVERRADGTMYTLWRKIEP